jgi:hypothetical protein
MRVAVRWSDGRRIEISYVSVQFRSFIFHVTKVKTTAKSTENVELKKTAVTQWETKTETGKF